MRKGDHIIISSNEVPQPGGPDTTPATQDLSAALAGLAAERDTLKDLYGAVFVDLQPELAEAWKAVIRRGLKPQEVRALCAPFVTEPELARLARTEWSNSETRNRMITEWSNRARDRYRALAGISD